MERITIPWPLLVSKNEKYTQWSNGRMALTGEYREAKEAVRLKASEQFKGDPYDWPIGLVLTFYEPTRHRRDIINYHQALVDGLEGVVFADDYWLFSLTSQRGGKDTENPRVEIEVVDLDSYTVDHHIREEDTDIGFDDS